MATDPMMPRDDGRAVVCGPLAAITVAGTDPQVIRRFYQGALGLTPTHSILDGVAAAALREHWGVAGTGPLEILVFTRPEVPEALCLRVVIVAPDRPVSRPALDSRFDGALGFGFPVRDLYRRHAIVEALGFEARAGVTVMSFPRADGTTYDIGETHWVAPDEVMVLGVDRAHLQPVGPIDPALDIGGPSYSSALVADAASAGQFFDEVLGLKLRREFTFESEGPNGGMRLPQGTRVHFQQWFAPGSRSGYLVVMQLLQNALRAPVRLAAPARGIAMWSFPTADLEATLQRARSHGTPVLQAAEWIEAPGEAAVRSAVLATPDGFPVEIFQR